MNQPKDFLYQDLSVGDYVLVPSTKQKRGFDIGVITKFSSKKMHVESVLISMYNYRSSERDSSGMPPLMKKKYEPYPKDVVKIEEGLVVTYLLRRPS